MSRRLTILLLSIILLLSCEDFINENPIISDKDILGEWFFTQPIDHYDFPAPESSFHGIQILESGISRLGIEHASGKVKVLDQHNYREIHSVGDGKIIIDRIYFSGMSRDTLYYSISNDNLFLDNGYEVETYKRTTLGTNINDPIETNLAFKFQDMNVKNLSTSSYVSAFASIKSATEFIIYSQSDDYILSLKINNFQGIGHYYYNKNRAEIYSLGGDVWNIGTTDSLTIGDISIEVYDQVQNRCSGTFSFTKYTYYENSPPGYFEVRNGEFEVPIYK